MTSIRIMASYVSFLLGHIQCKGISYEPSTLVPVLQLTHLISIHCLITGSIYPLALSTQQLWSYDSPTFVIEFAFPLSMRRRPKCLIDRYTKQHDKKWEGKSGIIFSSFGILNGTAESVLFKIHIFVCRDRTVRIWTFFTIQNSVKVSKIKALVSCWLCAVGWYTSAAAPKHHSVFSVLEICRLGNIEIVASNVCKMVFRSVGDGSCLASVQLNDFNGNTLWTVDFVIDALRRASACDYVCACWLFAVGCCGAGRWSERSERNRFVVCGFRCFDFMLDENMVPPTFDSSTLNRNHFTFGAFAKQKFFSLCGFVGKFWMVFVAWSVVKRRYLGSELWQKWVFECVVFSRRCRRLNRPLNNAVDDYHWSV